MTDTSHTRPANISDDTIAAVGKVSEAFETLQHARGLLYGLHQLIGRSDIQLQEAAGMLRQAGHDEQADMLERDIIGRNVLPGRWTFQIVEEFDDTYYQEVAKAEKAIRDQLVDGRRHIYESEMKERNRSHGQPGHEARPDEPVA